jgi:simple sugar transport system ATP-binding protein
MHLSLTDQTPMISLRGITKAFSGILANDHIDLNIFNAEIHALLGENGAGKSTLMKILFGFYRADSGDFLLDGKPISIQSPRDARAARIGMVFQDLNLIPAFSVAENIALFLPHLKTVLNLQEIEQRINEISKQYGLQVNLRSAGFAAFHRRTTEGGNPEIIAFRCPPSILDEPTRVQFPA